MPQAWVPNWPLQNGSPGVAWDDLPNADPTDPKVVVSRNRNTVVHTLGNMTMLSTALNSAQSNSAWDLKRVEMGNHSILPINNEVLTKAVWDEAAIAARAKALFDRALTIWTR